MLNTVILVKLIMFYILRLYLCALFDNLKDNTVLLK